MARLLLSINMENLARELTFLGFEINTNTLHVTILEIKAENIIQAIRDVRKAQH